MCIHLYMCACAEGMQKPWRTGGVSVCSLDPCRDTLFFRSAKKSGVPFLLIILYCQLKRVLAADSMLIVRPPSPHSLCKTKAKAMSWPPLLCCVSNGASMQKGTASSFQVSLYHIPFNTPSLVFHIEMSNSSTFLLSLYVFQTCVVPPRD